MGFLSGFSRRSKGGSEAVEKRDLEAVPGVPKSEFV
jgi:hypothetical protein